jgi:hypothetical protein
LMAEQPRFAFCSTCVGKPDPVSFNGINLASCLQNRHIRLFFAFPHPIAHAAGMPAPERNHVQVVRCKGIGCGRNVPTPVEVRVRTGSIAVLCPVCLERRSYIVSTEVFMGSPSWEVTRALQGRR